MGYTPDQLEKFFSRNDSYHSIKEEYKYIFNYDNGDVVIDGGAWIGDSALVHSMNVGEDGLVIAIECDPKSLAALRNGFDDIGNVKILDRALWSDTVIKDFYIDTDWTNSHTLLKDFISVRNNFHKVKIKTISIDSLIKRLKLDRVNHIQLNIEGAEVEALIGANEVIDKFKPDIRVSCHIINDELTTDDVINVLYNYGYHLIIVNDFVIYGSFNKDDINRNYMYWKDGNIVWNDKDEL